MLQELLECLACATRELRASERLHELLHLLRYAGNRLNMQGSLDCGTPHTADTVRAVMARYATALKLNDKLLQVLDTKTYHENGSKLVHFLVAMCAVLTLHYREALMLAFDCSCAAHHPDAASA